MFCLSIKRHSDSILLNIDVDGSPEHGDSYITGVSSGLPFVVKLRIDVRVLVMERVSEEIAVDLIDLLFELVADGLIT
jgi:hypothetical protein